MAKSLIIKSSSYVGNGVDDRAITGIGFEVKFLLIQGTAHAAYCRMAGMTGDQTKSFAGIDNYVIVGDCIQSLDVDGFTLGSNVRVNNDGETYHYVAIGWDNDSLATTIAYTGDGNDNRDVTGTTFTPAVVLIFGGGTGRLPSFKCTDMAGDAASRIGNVASEGLITNAIQAMNANGFQVGTSSTTNSSGVSYWALCLKDCALVKSITWTGNGSDNRNLSTLGLNPTYIICRNTTGSGLGRSSPHRLGELAGDASYQPSGTGGAQTNRFQAFITGGVQLGTDSEVNTNTNSYFGFALQDGSIAGGGGGGGGQGVGGGNGRGGTGSPPGQDKGKGKPGGVPGLDRILMGSHSRRRKGVL